MTEEPRTEHLLLEQVRKAELYRTFVRVDYEDLGLLRDLIQARDAALDAVAEKVRNVEALGIDGMTYQQKAEWNKSVLLGIIEEVRRGQ